MNYVYFNRDQKQLIENYLKENLIPEFKDQAIKFLPIAEKRIETICNSWLKAIKFDAKNSSAFQVKVRCYLDSHALELVQSIFCEKFEIFRLGHISLGSDTSYLKLLDETVPKKNTYTVNLGWTPDNRHVYQENLVKALKYTQSPEEKMKALLADAKKGQNTDLTFKVEEQTFYAHSIILKEKSIYFTAMLDSGCKEASQKNSIIPLSGISPATFEEFLQFAYIGSLENLCEAKDSLLLLDLFELAHLYQQDDLKNHVLELLNLSFDDLKVDVENPVAHLLNMAYLYESQELKNIAFSTLERLNIVSSVAIISTQPLSIFKLLEAEAEKLGNTNLTTLVHIITAVRNNPPQN